jgi:hypothetical protein
MHQQIELEFNVAHPNKQGNNTWFLIWFTHPKENKKSWIPHAGIYQIIMVVTN